MTTPDTHKLKAVRHLALDMDGTIYKGGTLFPFTRPSLARLEALGIGYTFLTNNSSKSAADYLLHLRKIGIPARPEQMQTSMMCAADYLRRQLPHAKRLYILGTPSLRLEFQNAGFEDVGDEAEPHAVVIGFDTGLTYSRLCKAAWWIKQGKPFIATHPDRICPTDLPTVLVDCGAVCAALESATGRQPDKVLGKPNPWMLQGILQRHGLQPHELAMVGDRIYTDMAMAQQAGAVGVLVLTGEATAHDAAQASPPPDFVAPDLETLTQWLHASRPTHTYANSTTTNPPTTGR